MAVLFMSCDVRPKCTNSESQCGELLLDEILHGLDIVVGRTLDLLDTLGVGKREVFVDGAQLAETCMIHILEFRQRKLAKGDEVLYLHTYAVTYESILRKIVGQRLRNFAVTAVDG